MELQIGKIYKTHNENNTINFKYEVVDIKKSTILYRIIENKSKGIYFNLYKGSLQAMPYCSDSMFVKNSIKL